MDRRVFTLLPILICWCAAPPSANAQQIPSPYRYVETGQGAGAFIGVLDPGRGVFQLGPGAGTLLGVRYEITVSGPFSIEGVARGLSTTRDVRDPRRTPGDRKIGEADALLTSLDARVKFTLTGRRTWHGLSPYVMAGGGIVWDMEGQAEIDDRLRPEDRYEFGTSFLGLLGLGIRWLVADHLELRADGALDLYQIDTPAGYRDPDRDLGLDVVAPESEWVNGLEGTVGISVRF